MSRCPTCHRRLRATTPCPQHGVTAASEPVEHAPAVEVGGYTLGELLGVGGYASVWRAHSDEGTEVALKVARSADPRVARRFEREAEALLRVGAPTVPALVDRGRLADGRPYLALERIAGQTLADRLGGAAQGLSLAEVLDVADAIAASLAAVHRAGVVHRDLKPENVIFDGGRARLIDFGLAVQPATTDELTLAGHVVGTPEYMAPEQLRPGAAIDARADVYAFGVVLFELCTLRVPFVGDASAIEHGHLHLRPPRVGVLAEEASRLEPVLARCLAKLPERRPADAGELQALLATARSATSEPTAIAAGPVRLASDLRPVLLVAVDARAPIAAVTELAERRGGFIAKQRGSHILCAFLASGEDDAVDAAFDAALETVERTGAATAVHVANLRVRRRRGVVSVFGEDVEQPERWLPTMPWSGAVASDAAAALTARCERAIDLPGGFARIGVEARARARPLPMIGRDEVLRDLRTDIETCIAERTPRLATVVGELGLGKTRIAQELVSALARQRELRVVRLRGRASAVAQLVDDLGALGDEARELLAEATPGMTPQEAVRTLGEALVRIARTAPLLLVVDDAERAESGLLDALEYATLDHRHAALAVVVLADARFAEQRPGWGRSAHRHRRIALPPLALADATALVAEAFAPADYIPREVLERLATWAGCNPLHILDVVASLERAGAIRERTVSRSRYLDVPVFERLASSRVEDWLVARAVTSLPDELAELARLCAVLGDETSTAEVDHVQAALAADAASADPEIGLGALVRHGLLEPAGEGRVRFRNPALRGALYRAIPEEARGRIHAVAAAFWDARGDEAARATFARHAAAAGWSARAGDALARLGDAALTRHQYASADVHYSAALELIVDGEARRRALAGRAVARRASYRTDDAIADVREARRLVAAASDLLGQADLLLDESTLLDLAERFDEAQAVVTAAAGLLAGASAPAALEAKLVMAAGRCRWRAEDLTQAVDQLARAAELARAAGDADTRAIALVLLAPALVLSQRPREATARFEEVIALCVERNDLLHLAASYVNRLFLWTSLHRPDLAVRDLQQAMQLARELGHPLPERAATHNLAELLHWQGARADEALRLAERSRALQERLFDRAVPEDGLLLARIHLDRGELVDAERQLAWIEREHGAEVSPTVRLLGAALRLALCDLDAARAPAEPAGWDALEREGEEALPGEERIELLWLRARAARARERDTEARDALARARSLVADTPIWEHRLAATLPA